MIAAEVALVSQGDAAVPVLQALLDGSAKNGDGVPYRSLGLPLRCALEVAARLGPKAKPLEQLLIADVEAGESAAAVALGRIGHASNASIECLDARMDSSTAPQFDMPFEAAGALIRLKAAAHPVVINVLSESAKARSAWATAERHLRT